MKRSPLAFPRSTSIGFLASAILAAAFAVPAAAQDYSGEAFVVEQSRTAWRFERDGTGSKEVTLRVKVQSDAGVQTLGQLPFSYNAANERLDVVSVRVLKADGSSVSASADAVQDLTSPVERTAPVYTDLHVKHVTVPGLRPGDVLDVHVRTTLHTPLAPGQFWIEHDFATSGIVLDEQLQVDIPADQRVTLKTRPGAEPTIVVRNGRCMYDWRTSRRTNDRTEDHKGESSARKHAATPAVRMTTFPDWSAVARWYGSLERRQKEPTPEIRRKASELIAGRKTDLEKIEALYEYVAAHFRYVSLSFGVGRYQPHAAADVLHNQYGDCKDKHTLLASLVESIGLRASAALVNTRADLDPDFPSPSQFDHVITRVSTGAGDVWLDTTTEVAPFRLLLPSLRKKRALVVDADGGGLRETPAESPVTNSSEIRIDGTLDESGTLSAHVHLAVSGDFELLTRTVFRQTSSAEWKSLVGAMASRAGLDAEVVDWKVSDPAAIREPFTIEYHAVTANYVRWTKKAFDLDLPLADFMSVLPEDDDSESAKIDLPPRRSVYRVRLELPGTYSAHPPLAIATTRDYAEYRAEYRVEGVVFTAERTLDVRGSELPAERHDDYTAFRRVVSRDMQQTLALERSAGSITSAMEQLKPVDLYKSGYDALEAGSYAQAVTLLTRVTEVEPQHKSAWNNLGRAYLELRQTDAAIGAFRKQIEINRYDLYSYNNLGRAYTAQRKFREAESAFKKQLEIDPLNLQAHANLGGMYLEWRKHDAAAAELEKAIALSPQDSTLRIRLGEAYLNLGDHDRAMAAFDRAVALAPDPRTWNEIAYQLALNKTDLDLARRYAESAVAARSLASRNISVDHVTALDLWHMSELAADWDTLGCVHLAQGDVNRAERFVRASWLLLQNAEVGDHLGQIYEKLGRRDDAARMYALALNAERPDEKTRERLVALVGGGDRVEAALHAQHDALARERTIVLDKPGPAGASADFFVVLARSSVETVKFIGGDERLRPLGEALRKAAFDVLFPDDDSVKIVRRGTLSCAPEGGSPGCRFVMMLPYDAQLAQQD